MARAIIKESGAQATRFVYHGFDAMWVLADALKRSGSLEPEKIIEALEKTDLKASRGMVTFSKESGPFYHQWIDVPQVIFQYSEVGQKTDNAPIVWPSDSATAKPARPGK
jgi:branched-chain amino acid transport system substrate-binding protein